jgi:hypothetical protein
MYADDDKADALAKSVINEVQELAVKIGLLVTYEVRYFIVTPGK